MWPGGTRVVAYFLSLPNPRFLLEALMLWATVDTRCGMSVLVSFLLTLRDAGRARQPAARDPLVTVRRVELRSLIEIEWSTCVAHPTQSRRRSPRRVHGRVEEWRGGVQGRRRPGRAAPFVAALAEKPIAPFPLPAHRTGRDHLGHPALGRVSHGGMRGRHREDASNENTPSSPKTRASGNCR